MIANVVLLAIIVLSIVSADPPVAVNSLGRSSAAETTLQAFQQYKTTFSWVWFRVSLSAFSSYCLDKKYDNSSKSDNDETRRFSYFSAVYQKVTAHNNDPVKSKMYRMQLNPFADAVSVLCVY
jgi:hypothetical protein